MKKRILIFIATIIVAFFFSYLPHQYFISTINKDYSVLFEMYLFHSISSVIVYLFIELIFNKLPNQTGFAFLTTVFVKIGFFMLFFSSDIYDVEVLEMYMKLAIILPFFLFLIIEAIFSFSLLNKADYEA